MTRIRLITFVSHENNYTVSSHASVSLTCSDPDARQRVCVHLVTFYESLSLLMHVDAAVLPIVDLVVPHDGVTVGADLDACQCVTCGEE